MFFVFAEYRADTCIELVFLKRFADEVVHTQSNCLAGCFGKGIGTQADDGRIALGGGQLLSDIGGSLEAIHGGHLQIHQNKIETFCLKSFEHFDTCTGKAYRDFPFFKNLLGYKLIQHVVFGKQYFQPFQRHGRSGCERQARKRFFDCAIAELHFKRAALIEAALHVELPLLHIYQLLGDSQTKAGALCFALVVAGLCKHLKDRSYLALRNANACILYHKR